ncbi:hypothetical protein HOV43_gp094 [Escherichia phage vB_EcoM_KWBSE43-6]|uniref:Uncharacterized protein n=1 Tax=Escherichia phage vB_EcoM_KWBSE43-6 TaxID=2508194 RepID=A0A482N0B7_9CAUD|nr:hypothetical protein HOV43_gp094 [Escherichia phage vB_EcoM_KWBSE43-6]QBQ78922.1 hypothetical protein KWBSE43_00094 [Escherichia phage vB_EcoM_KWBSE43-6]
MVRLRHKPNQFALGMLCGISFMICLENAVSLVAAPDFPLVRFILSGLFGAVSVVSFLIASRKL